MFANINSSFFKVIIFKLFNWWQTKPSQGKLLGSLHSKNLFLNLSLIDKKVLKKRLYAVVFEEWKIYLLFLQQQQLIKMFIQPR